jgi:hypothetical protein
MLYFSLGGFDFLFWGASVGFGGVLQDVAFASFLVCC